ncbi:MAG: DUF6516 family protein [bacterium]
MQAESNTVKAIASKLNLSSDEILHKSLQTFLEKTLRELKTEIVSIQSKYGIASAEEFEQKYKDGTIYRHDNAPHLNREKVKTFSKHFHEGSEEKVIESHISDNPPEALREFLKFGEKSVL